MEFLTIAKRFLWEFVELGFLAVLSLILIHLLLGESAGPYVVSVADNAAKFAGGAGAAGLVGIAIVVTIVYLIMRRLDIGGDMPAAPRRRNR